MVNYSKMASEIIACVGGKENIRDLFHCATRLRFSLVDESRQIRKRSKRLMVYGVVPARSGSCKLSSGRLFQMFMLRSVTRPALLPKLP